MCPFFPWAEGRGSLQILQRTWDTQTLKWLLCCWHWQASKHSAFGRSKELTDRLSGKLKYFIRLMSWSIPLLFAVHRKSHLEKASTTGFKTRCKMQFNWKWLPKQKSSWLLTQTQGDTSIEMCFCFLYSTGKNLSQKKRRVQWTMSIWSLSPKVLLILKYAKWRPWASQLQCWATWQKWSNKALKSAQFCVPLSRGKGSKVKWIKLN